MIDAVGVLIEFVTYLELVKIDALTVGMFVYRTRLDDQRRILVILRVKVYGDPVKSRRSKPVAHRSRAVGIEAKHREDSPCAHRTRIIIAWDTAGFVAIIQPEELARDTLCAPCLLGEVGEEVGISDVGLISWVVVLLIEDALELVDELAFTSHELRKTTDIVGDVEAIVPRVPFVEAWVRLEVATEGGVEGREELPIGEDRTK